MSKLQLRHLKTQMVVAGAVALASLGVGLAQPHWLLIALGVLLLAVSVPMLVWLSRYEPQPDEWIWRPGEGAGPARRRLRERWPYLVMVIVLGGAVFAPRFLDLSQTTHIVILAIAIAVALPVVWVAQRRNSRSDDAE